MEIENDASSIYLYYKQYIQKLYLSGLAEQLSFGKKAQDVKQQFRQAIIAGIKNNETTDENPFDRKGKLLNLFKLLCFIQAWADLKETWGINPPDENKENKKIRQSMKFKKHIDKSIRRSIHVGLFKLVSESLFHFQQLAENDENAEKTEFIKELFGLLEKPSTESNTKEKLLNVINKLLKKEEFINPESREIDKYFSEAGKVISAFTLWPDKLLYGCGMGMGLIAALACGISTSAAIFLLLVSLSAPLGFVILVSLLFFLAGTRANFQLFSQHIPRFLQDLCKSGGVTEFIDHEGRRLQLSAGKKLLLLPAAFFSLSVGIATAAITVLEGTKIIVLICPMLAVACPYLPAILLGILASTLLIGLTVVMFRAFTSILQSQFSWGTLKETVKIKWKELNWTKGLAYAFEALVMIAALFGLFFLSITGAPTLAVSLGWIAAYGISIAAFIGDVPFTLITALALCTSLLTKKDSNSDLTKDKRYYSCQIVKFFALIINALGNAALVFADSWTSRIASIACFMNSYANNRIQDDDSELIQARADATKKSLESLRCTFFGPSSLEIQLPEEVNSVVVASQENSLTVS